MKLELMINTSFYHIDKDINKLLDKAQDIGLTQRSQRRRNPKICL